MKDGRHISEKHSVPKTGQLFNKLGTLTAGCLVLFLQSGSFKACGVLFDNAVQSYGTSNLFGGWVFTLQPAACFITSGLACAFLPPRVENRAIGVIGGILFGLGFTLQGLFGHTFYHLFLFIGISAAGSGLLQYATYMAFTDHFPDCFQLAYSIRDVFVYLGITVLPFVLELVRGEYGLKGSFLILGSIAFHGVLSGVLLKSYKSDKYVSKRETENEFAPSFGNEYRCSKDDRYIQKESPFMSFLCLPSLQYHPLFVLFNILHAFLCFNYAAWALFLVPFGLSRGYSPDVAVYMSTSGGLGGLGGKLVVIALFYFKKTNRIGLNLVTVLVYGISMAGYVLFSDYILMLTSSFLSGFSLAFADAVTCALLPTYLCTHHLRQGLVVSYLASGLAIQLGGIIAGAILDMMSSFSVIFSLMSALNIGIGILAFTMEKLEGHIIGVA